jgi:DNA (cytosine-5)-methyltransferase 1
MWPDTIRVIREVRPRFAFLENVPGLMAHEYFGTVLGDLAESGYDAEWTVLGADDCGAPHRRKRLWILASLSNALPTVLRTQQGGTEPGRLGEAESGDDGAAESVAHATVEGLERWERPEESRPTFGLTGTRCAQTDPERQGLRQAGGLGTRTGDSVWWRMDPADERPGSESFVGRVAHGVADRRNRLAALGDGQVPIVAATAWRILFSRIGGVNA